jgi:hypothetical protein
VNSYCFWHCWNVSSGVATTDTRLREPVWCFGTTGMHQTTVRKLQLTSMSRWNGAQWLGCEKYVYVAKDTDADQSQTSECRLTPPTKKAWLALLETILVMELLYHTKNGGCGWTEVPLAAFVLASSMSGA